MWFFSRDSTKDINYDFGEKIKGLEDSSIWTLYEGKKKGTGDLVSVFAYDLKNGSEGQTQLAKAAFKRIKTLRHPNFLTYIDGVETDKVIYIVTEYVVPLVHYLESTEHIQQQLDLSISWGLHQVIKALGFLNNDASLVHNNICMSSVFVDQAGVWKLGGLDYMYSATEKGVIPPLKVLPVLEKYDPPERNDTRGHMMGLCKWSTDMWGLGCLIWEVFNGPLPNNQSLKITKKLPRNLVAHYCQLVSANPKARPNPGTLMEELRVKDSFFDNGFVHAMLFLEEMQIKEAGEKSKFFGKLTDSLHSFPQDACRYCILPQLLNAYEFGNAGAAVLTPMFKLGKLLDAEDYQKKIVPCVIKLFSSTDRATRVGLLQKIDCFVEHLQPSIVNDQIFLNIANGFMDTNPALREHTVKSMLLMAPKLNYNNLNVELMKHFARLQSKDEQGGIRTNTTVCLGKIAGHLHPLTRQRVLLSAFTRAMKDPFPPARTAGVLAMVSTQNYYTIHDCALRVLPSLAALTVDPDKGVREQAFKAMQGFIGKLQKAHENPDLIPELESDVNSGAVPSTARQAASWAGWAVTSLTSKFYRGVPAGSTQDNKTSDEKPSEATKAQVSQKSSMPSNARSRQPAAPVPKDVAEDDASDYEDGDKWSNAEDWGDMGDLSTQTTERPGPSRLPEGGHIETTERSRLAVASPVADDGWGNEGDWGDDAEDEEEEWGSLEEPTVVNPHGFQDRLAEQSGTMTLTKVQKSQDPWNDWGGKDFSAVKDSTTIPASAYNWGNPPASADFFSTTASSTEVKSNVGKRQQTTSQPTSIPEANSYPSAKQTAVPSSSDEWNTGRGEWDDSGWGIADNKSKQPDDAKRQREEKRLQRQRELAEKRAMRQAGGGAMKLGARKLN
ncbi:PREDICTED: N-terminal kinase-like protein [Priapulus caudatus]|uniref:N-terminal kinase-like protein n=1 Tax=Priapulus caudatus TaxID=37621 RepID=A0ABM1EB09_PRICU|nr:PREDICTED: N-terminal kinase-like protein [Priapulus caudatus]